jgi:hypothetical protein
MNEGVEWSYGSETLIHPRKPYGGTPRTISRAWPWWLVLKIEVWLSTGAIFSEIAMESPHLKDEGVGLSLWEFNTSRGSI